MSCPLILELLRTAKQLEEDDLVATAWRRANSLPKVWDTYKPRPSTTDQRRVRAAASLVIATQLAASRLGELGLTEASKRILGAKEDVLEVLAEVSAEVQGEEAERELLGKETMRGRSVAVLSLTTDLCEAFRTYLSTSDDKEPEAAEEYAKELSHFLRHVGQKSSLVASVAVTLGGM